MDHAPSSGSTTAPPGPQPRGQWIETISGRPTTLHHAQQHNTRTCALYKPKAQATPSTLLPKDAKFRQSPLRQWTSKYKDAHHHHHHRHHRITIAITTNSSPRTQRVGALVLHCVRGSRQRLWLIAQTARARAVHHSSPPGHPPDVYDAAWAHLPYSGCYLQPKTAKFTPRTSTCRKNTKDRRSP